MGTLGEAAGAAGGIMTATGVGATIGAPLATVGAAAKAVDFVGDDLLGFWS